MSKYTPLKDIIRGVNSGWYDESILSSITRYKVTTTLRGIHNETIVVFTTNELMGKVRQVLSHKDEVSCITPDYDASLINSIESARIEGADTDVEKVIYCLHNKNIHISERMAISSYNGMLYAISDKSVLSEVGSLKLWDIVSYGCCENASVQGSVYRSGDVYVGSLFEIAHVPAPPSVLPSCMKSLFNYISGVNSGLSVLINSIIIHFYYLYIHPMCDCNGRVARILMHAYLQHNGYEWLNKVPIVSGIRKDVSGYYRSLKVSQEPVNGMIDVTPFVMYMLDVIYSSVRDFTSYSVELSDIERKLISKMSRKGKGSEISVRGCSRVLKVSENDALFVLMSMVDKGVLVRNGNVYKLC